MLSNPLLKTHSQVNTNSSGGLDLFKSFLGVSLLAAQVLAGVATNGVNLGKRDLTEAEMRGFWEDFLNNAILGPVNDALQGK